MFREMASKAAGYTFFRANSRKTIVIKSFQAGTKNKCGNHAPTSEAPTGRGGILQPSKPKKKAKSTFFLFLPKSHPVINIPLFFSFRHGGECGVVFSFCRVPMEGVSVFSAGDTLSPPPSPPFPPLQSLIRLPELPLVVCYRGNITVYLIRQALLSRTPLPI